MRDQEAGGAALPRQRELDAAMQVAGGERVLVPHQDDAAAHCIGVARKIVWPAQAEVEHPGGESRRRGGAEQRRAAQRPAIAQVDELRVAAAPARIGDRMLLWL